MAVTMQSSVTAVSAATVSSTALPLSAADKEKLKLLKREYKALREMSQQQQKALEEAVAKLKSENEVLRAQLGTSASVSE